MNNAIRRLLFLAPAILAAGCAVRPVTELPPDRPETPVQAQERRTKASRPTYNLTGYPPAVRDGYIDGCESAKGSEYARKDAQRFAADPQYSMGWNDGFGICGKK
jgi:predicted small lipoprotein YifL